MLGCAETSVPKQSWTVVYL